MDFQDGHQMCTLTHKSIDECGLDSHAAEDIKHTGKAENHWLDPQPPGALWGFLVPLLVVPTPRATPVTPPICRRQKGTNRAGYRASAPHLPTGRPANPTSTPPPAPVLRQGPMTPAPPSETRHAAQVRPRRTIETQADATGAIYQ
ncbi:hypothetical protein PtB15_10B254 [Puccinia triticina]|nr:hypothetical protein PtB15_10B254 [Puccinia triticina]